MSTLPPTNKAARLNLNKKLHIIRMTNSVIIHQAVANQFEMSITDVADILKSRRSLGAVKVSEKKRKNLDLNDKIRVIHYMHKHINAVKVSTIFKTNPRTVRRCCQNRVKLMEVAGVSTRGSSKRPLRA